MKRPVLRVFAAAWFAATVSCDVSKDEEVAIGSETAQQMQNELPIVNDPYIVSYISTGTSSSSTHIRSMHSHCRVASST
jgi:hypothetical protein